MISIAMKLTPIWWDLKIMGKKIDLVLDGKSQSFQYKFLDTISDILWYPQIIQFAIARWKDTRARR